MTITFDHPGGPGIVFVLALAYRHIVGYTLTAEGLQPDYKVSQWTNISETTEREFRLEIYNWPDTVALIQVCARSAEGRYDEECPLR